MQWTIDGESFLRFFVDFHLVIRVGEIDDTEHHTAVELSEDFLWDGRRIVFALQRFVESRGIVRIDANSTV